MRKTADKPVDVYLVIGDEKIQLTPREIKHLRRAVHHYDWRIAKTTSLTAKLCKMGWVHVSLNRISDLTPTEKANLRKKKRCFICEKEKVLVIHHRIPATAKSSSNRRHNLVVVCRKCHNELHDKIIQKLRKKYKTYRNEVK